MSKDCRCNTNMWREGGVIADARALHVRLRMRGLHGARVLRLRGLTVVTLDGVLLRAAHGGVVYAGRGDGVGRWAAGSGMRAGNQSGKNENNLESHFIYFVFETACAALRACN